MLVLHFDYTSLAAAVAVLRLQRLADEGRAIAFQGIDVLGVDATIPATVDQLAELERWGERATGLGLEVRRPVLRPPTLAAHLVGELAEDRGRGAAWRARVLRAYWSDGADLADQALLADVAVAVGIDRAVAEARLADPAARLALRQRMALARRQGIGGVPVLELSGTLLSADTSDDDLRRLAGL